MVLKDMYVLLVEFSSRYYLMVEKVESRERWMTLLPRKIALGNFVSIFDTNSLTSKPLPPTRSFLSHLDTTVLSQYAKWSCQFFDAKSNSSIPDTSAFGIFCYTSPISGNEWGYPDNLIPDDSTLATVQRIAIANTIIGFCAWVITLFSCFFFCCKRFLHFLYVLTGLMLLANSGLEGSNFLLWNSDLCANNSCELGVGAKCSISAACLYFVAAFFTCGRGKNSRRRWTRMTTRNRIRNGNILESERWVA